MKTQKNITNWRSFYKLVISPEHPGDLTYSLHGKVLCVKGGQLIQTYGVLRTVPGTTDQTLYLPFGVNYVYPLNMAFHPGIVRERWGTLDTPRLSINKSTNDYQIETLFQSIVWSDKNNDDDLDEE